MLELLLSNPIVSSLIVCGLANIPYLLTLALKNGWLYWIGNKGGAFLRIVTLEKTGDNGDLAGNSLTSLFKGLYHGSMGINDRTKD